MNFATTKQRLMQYLDFKGIKIKEFYEKTGIKRGFLDADKLESSVSDVFLAIILANFSDINPIWLISGNGDKIKQNYYENSVVHEPSEVYNTRSDKNISMQRIPLYSLEVSAGIVQLFRDHVPTKEYISIPNLPKCDGALYVNGDSMYPLLKSGDIVMYKQIQDINSCIYIWGEMYLVAFEVDGDIYTAVKYIQKSTSIDNIKLVSQNKHHDDIDIPKKSIRALALVKASIRINAMN